MTASRVLVVEDEAMIAMLLETYLEGMDCDVVAVAGNVQEAVRMATQLQFDFALLDINLNGQKAHALPGILLRLKKPFAFVTGYGEQGILDAYATAPVVKKPFDESSILLAVKSLKKACTEASSQQTAG